MQYLHQLGLLDILPRLVDTVIVPEAVADELAEGRRNGVDVPDPAKLPWAAIRCPGSPSALRLASDLGPGEASVLALAMELPDPVVIIDDLLGRRVAEALGIPLRGTLGVLLDAKRAGLIDAVAPVVERLLGLGFWLAPETAALVLRLAGESGRA